MPELDTNNCTMNDVITRAVLCHPSLFRDAMLEVAKGHWAHSNECKDSVAARIALGMANNLRRMADEIDMDDFDAESLTLAERVQAFGVAARLSVIPRHIQTQIAERS